MQLHKFYYGWLDLHKIQQEDKLVYSVNKPGWIAKELTIKEWELKDYALHAYDP